MVVDRHSYDAQLLLFSVINMVATKKMKKEIELFEYIKISTNSLGVCFLSQSMLICVSSILIHGMEILLGICGALRLVMIFPMFDIV